MDIFTLDGQLRRTELIDVYESMIWTDRYAGWGDFQLDIRSDQGSRSLLLPGTRLAIQKSDRVMVVETVEDGVSSEGVAKLTVTGRSLEATLEDRINRRTFVNNEPANHFGLPANIVTNLFDMFVRNNTSVTQDQLPFLVDGSLYPPGTIPRPSTLTTISLPVEPLYKSIKDICDRFNLGFRIVREGDTSRLYFDVYTGHDRTSLVTTRDSVIFSPELDNLSDTKSLTSMAYFKNVAYVYSKIAAVTVYADNVTSEVSGFDRRVLNVDASDIDLPAGTDHTNALIRKGKEELAKHRALMAFDGEIPQSGSYEYGVHYGLGDLVEKRNSDGLATNMRVTEQIFVSDLEGERSYPTLAIDMLITPGSWLAWESSQTWENADKFWETA